MRLSMGDVPVAKADSTDFPTSSGLPLRAALGDASRIAASAGGLEGGGDEPSARLAG